MVFKKRDVISLILKALIILSAVSGLSLVFFGNGSFMAGAGIYYFTIQSNIAIMVIAIFGFVLKIANCAKGRPGLVRWCHRFNYIGTVAITLTGFVYCFFLAEALGEQAWDPVNLTLHVFTPILAIIDFLLVAWEGDVRFKDFYMGALFPGLYMVFAILAYCLNWNLWLGGTNYPYFFFNFGAAQPFIGGPIEGPWGSIVWLVMLTGFLMIVGMLFLSIVEAVRAIVKKTKQKAA